MKTKTYARLYYAGVIVAETSDREVETRDIDSLDVSNMCYAVQFYDQDEDVVEVFGKKKLVKDDPKNWSPLYYFGGKIVTAKDARIEGYSTLADNMKRNGWEQAVMTKHGQAFPIQGDQKVEILSERRK